MGKFHDGELAIQKRSGVAAMARRVGMGIHPFIFDAAAEFLTEQSFVVLAASDSQQHVWASLLTGKPGFLQPLSATTLRINQTMKESDPLWRDLVPDSAIGLIAIDFATRHRLRVNGVLVDRTEHSLDLETREVYGNCQKYIQARAEGITDQPAVPIQSFQTQTLSAEQQAWITAADTFFIASLNPLGGADASHRGGNPGFVRVISDTELLFPDYSGNMMFNTLGNIALNPSAGLLFLDFQAGRTLQLAGHAEIIWDHAQAADFPGAQRLVKFSIVHAIETDGLGFRFGMPEYSRFNPR